MVFLVEKEYGFPIYDDFPLMKFWNLLDEAHLSRYKADTESKMNRGKGTIG